jgi:hypothetical protein
MFKVKLGKNALFRSATVLSLLMGATAQADIFPVLDCGRAIGDVRWCEKYSFYERRTSAGASLVFLRKTPIFLPLSGGNAVVALTDVPNPTLMFVLKDERPDAQERAAFEEFRARRAQDGSPLPAVDPDLNSGAVSFGNLADEDTGPVTIDDMLRPPEGTDTSLSYFLGATFQSTGDFTLATWNLAPLGEKLFKTLALGPKTLSAGWLSWQARYTFGEDAIVQTSWIDCLATAKRRSGNLPGLGRAPYSDVIAALDAKFESKMLRFDTCK